MNQILVSNNLMRQALRKQDLNHHHLIGQQRPLVSLGWLANVATTTTTKMNPWHYAPNPKLLVLNPTFMLIAPNYNNGDLTRSQQETKKIKIMKVNSWGVSCNMNRDNARKWGGPTMPLSFKRWEDVRLWCNLAEYMIISTSRLKVQCYSWLTH